MSINNKVLKYGTASIVLAVVFIAFIFAVNLIVGIVADKFNLYVDLTSEELYSISDETFSLLEDMDEPVKIIFFTPLDQLDNSSNVKNIKTLALEYEEKFDNITVEYIDMTRNPDLVRRYRKDLQLSDTSVIVESEKRFVGFDMSECFVWTQSESGSYSIYAFNGEYRFTSSLLKVTRDTMPVITFTSNHGEEIPSALKKLFSDSGFDVQTINLLQNDIPEDTEILLIVAPQYDLTGVESEEEGKSEITKLNAFLSRGKDLMVFVDPNTPELPNLDDFLYTWGIDVLHGVAVQDNSNYLTGTNNMALLSQYYSEDENTVDLHSSVSTKTSPMTAVSYYSSPISIVPLTNVSRGVSPILVSHPSSYVPKTSQENYIENTRIPLLVAGYNRTFNSETGETDKNYVIVGGSTSFVSDQFIDYYSAQFANSELLRAMTAEMTDETIVLNMPYKVYNNTALEATNEQSQKWGIALITVLPAIVLVAALAVFLKRRHK